jgi:glycosyltransferase involved in cell wall biosynthesis
MGKPTLVMIVRDEAQCIGRCLASARPFVARMIVVDTGSRDATVAIARELGAQVHELAWGDDFAAARNAALALSDADWNLVLDADEAIAPGADPAALAALLDGAAPFVGLLPVASTFDLQGQVATGIAWIARLLPRGVRYEGRIHEQPVSALPRRRVALPLAHDGYRRQRLQQKAGRNQALLQCALAEAPDDPYLLYQLGKNQEVYEDFGQAAASFLQALERAQPDAPFRHDLVVRSLFSLKKAQRHEDAIRLADLEMDNWGHSPDYHFALGDLLLDWVAGNPAGEVDQLLAMVEASWLKCLALGDQPELDGTVLGRGSFLAAHNLAVLYDGLGNQEQAAYFRALAQAGGQAGKCLHRNLTCVFDN